MIPIRLDTSRTLNLATATDHDKASFLQSLREGQTLQARVVDQTPDGRWVLRIQGQDLLAESQQPLTKGQAVRAQVTHAGPPVVLSILEEAADSGEMLSRALRDLGLGDDPAGRAVLGRMIARQLPLDGAGVERLRDALARMSPDMSDTERVNRTVDAMLLLASRSVPITPGTLAAALAAPAPGALGGLIGSLLDLIRDLSPGLRDAAEADARALELALTGLMVGGEEISEADLRRLLRDGGLGLEGKLMALAEGAVEKEALQRLTQTDLTAALLRLAAALNDPGRGGDADGALRGRTGDALRYLEHLQIVNLPARDDPNAHLLLQFPLLFGQERTTAELRIFYSAREGRRRIDPENVRVALRLDLAHLGGVEVDLRVVAQVVDCRIEVDGAAQQALFNGEQEALRAGLEGAGYRVRKVACEVRPETERADASGGGQARIGLDVRA